MQSNKDRLATIVKKFRILSDWKIDYDADSQYKGQCCKNVKTKKATVYAWHSDEKEPDDYLFHEVLHIAMAHVINSFKRESYEQARKKEELLIQDICKIVGTCSNKFQAQVVKLEDTAGLRPAETESHVGSTPALGNSYGS